MADREFDVIVIGAGPPGEVCAGRIAAKTDLDVAIVEGHLVGGECSYYACMPSKALLRPAEALAEVRRVPGAAEAAGGELDVAAALARRDEVVHDGDDAAQLPWLSERGIELFRGEGRLDGERRVQVGDDVLTARRAVVIATGSADVIPPIDGLADAAPWSNREITTASSVPESLIALGGGAVGCEMAQAWSSFGSRVTLIEAEPRLLPTEEPFAGEQLAEALEQHGVDVRVGARATAVERGNGEVRVTLDDGSEARGAEILVSVGRRGNVEGIGLESVGIEPQRFLEVDERMRVGGSDWLYAAGDVNGRALLTHIGKHQARVAADQIAGGDSAVGPEEANPPRVVFTDPEVAAVGLTLERAREAGIDARAVDAPSSGTAGASFHGRDAPGTSRIVVDEGRGVIVGASFVGAEVGEWLHAATIAIAGEVPLERLWHAVPAFPTRSEIWLNLLESYGM